MFSSHILKGIIALSLLATIPLQAQQPINLDDSNHTFSSITIPSKPEPRTFSPYLISGIATYLVSGFCCGVAFGTYTQYSSLPWWQTGKKAQSVTTGIKTAATITGLYWAHKLIETRRHTLNSIREKARKIIGARSLFDAIKTDNVEHIKAWIEYDQAMLHLDYGRDITEYAFNQSSLFAKRDQNGRTAIMLATLANSINVLELILNYQETYVVNKRDNQGNSALHMAVQNKHYEIESF